MSIDFKSARFIKSAAQLSQCVSDTGREVAFVGRSNAGKSSAMNALIGSKQVRVSKTPGRTQLINFFSLDTEAYRLVDLPGYGYAEVPIEIKQAWEKALNDYFEARQSLVGVVLLCDIRHGIKEADQVLIDYVTRLNLPIQLLLTKSDKLSNNQAKNQWFKVEKSLLSFAPSLQVQLFSALSLKGLEELKIRLNQWFLD